MKMEEIKQVIKEACKSLFDVEVEPVLARTQEKFGDYATNVALQLAGQLKMNPQEIAQAVAGKLASADGVASATVAGPGFINLTLSDTALIEAADSPVNQPLKGQIVVAEYSDPNPLKPLHAGHLYTTLVGDNISKLLEAAGARVIRINYGGDVGLHVARSMWAIMKSLGGEHPEKLEQIPEAERPAWLGERYVEGTRAYEDDEAAKAEIIEINKRVYRLHAEGDKQSAFARIYWMVRKWSYDYFEALYEQLQVTPFDRFIPESEVAELGLETVRRQLAKGVYEESEGAVVFKGEKHGLHTRVFINSAGLPTYEAKDVGLLLRKWQDYQFDMSLVITSNEQAQYYQVMLKSVEQFNPEPVEKSRHLTHGVVKLQGGVKMSSRKGNIVSAVDILEAATAAGENAQPAHSRETVLAAVKYAFAKNRIGGDIIYDPEESVALEGNSGPYLQYAYARANSILAKAGSDNPETPLSANMEPGERSLVRKLGEYAEAVDIAVEELMPHHMCTYLYELAQAFNRFYENNQVIGSEREKTRLGLVALYAKKLKEGLELLGIPVPERM